MAPLLTITTQLILTTSPHIQSFSPHHHTNTQTIHGSEVYVSVCHHRHHSTSPQSRSTISYHSTARQPARPSSTPQHKPQRLPQPHCSLFMACCEPRPVF
ncbi:hypothetical protein E2C01_040978 [Portunus trituberculatus]|uniref:Uncharacterized protein n=1 Tax=Portunus trituberculatus TaxID=210409 RepID=A0A5B7FPF9_PORTR|nr:hypothetical protein [Portunus trituberculatus]